MNETIIIKKLNEITKWIEGIIKNSKPIHELNEIQGEEFWMAVSNGETTGKRKVQDFELPDLTLPYKWHLTDLTIGVPISISNEKLNFDLTINDSNVLNGFYGELNDGMFGSIHNNTNSPITLKHLHKDPTVTIPLAFSSGTDYILKPNETLNYKYSLNRNQLELSVYDSSSFVKLKKKIELHRFNANEIEQPTIYIDLDHKPNSIDEFVDVHINGVYVGENDFIIDENTLIIALSNIEYQLESTMEVTINYKY